jgi:hypothetical protein
MYWTQSYAPDGGPLEGGVPRLYTLVQVRATINQGRYFFTRALLCQNGLDNSTQ